MTVESGWAPGQAHHRRIAFVLRFLSVASIVLPALILFAGGMITWREKHQEALDQTVRLVDLVYESTSKLFEAKLLATDQARPMIGTLDDAQLPAGGPPPERRRQFNGVIAASIDPSYFAAFFHQVLHAYTDLEDRTIVLPIILVSGYNDATPEQTSEYRLLRKPLPAEHLAQAIRAEFPAYPRIAVDNTLVG